MAKTSGSGRVKRVILCLGSKGGVGKSTVGRALLDLLRKGGRLVSAHDLDSNTASLSLVYDDRDPVRGVAPEELRANAGAWSTPTLWASAIANDVVDDVLLDIPGGGLQDFMARFAAGVETLRELAHRGKREIVVVSVIGILDDSFMTAQDVFDVFGSHAHHVVVKNGFFASSPDHFVLFDGAVVNGQEVVPRSMTRKRADELKAEIVFFPRMDPIAQQIAAFHRLTYAQASDYANEEKMGDPLQLANMRTWLDMVAKNFRGTWIDPNVAGSSANNLVAESASVA